MSPEAKRTFEAEWPVLSGRLRALLARKGIDRSLHDDLVQETALRLLSMWDTVDRRRPLWPLTVTIALNLLRDRGRQVERDDLVAEVPELGAVHDVEAASLARIELQRVRSAMRELSGSQRSALMKEVGGHALATAPDSSSDKMLRMRARRKLKLALENVSAVIALRLRRIAEVLEGAFAAREGVVSAASCVLCLIVGIGAGIAPPPGLTPHAAAGPTSSAADPSWSLDLAGRLDIGIDTPLARGAWTGAGAANEPSAGTAGRSAVESEDGRKAGATRRAKNASSGSADGSDGDGRLIGVLPQDEDQVVSGAANTVEIGVDHDDATPLPDGDPGDGTPAAEPPAPPAPPPAPAPPVTGAVPLPPLTEEATELL